MGVKKLSQQEETEAISTSDYLITICSGSLKKAEVQKLVENIVIDNVTPEKTTFFDYRRYKNLIDYSEVVIGEFVWNAGTIGTSAVNTQYPNASRTGYIPVEAGKTYYIGEDGQGYDSTERPYAYVSIGCFYTYDSDTDKYTCTVKDTEMAWIKESGRKIGFTVENDGYVILSNLSGNYPEKIQLNEGAIYPYSEYGVEVIDNVKLKTEYLDFDGSSLATVATTGSYNDLTDAPELADIATTGSYNDLADLPAKEYEGKNILILGDSITSLGGDYCWVKYFSEEVNPNSYVNVAVAGATWHDQEENQEYDGDPQSSTTGNVIGNQVQKVINQKAAENADYDDFDVIIIAAGTNDTLAAEDTIDNVESQFVSTYGDSFDVVSLDDVNRQTWAGAMRYAYEKLLELYPNAEFVFCTPLQECFESYESIYNKGDLMKYIASRLSINCWDTRDCGILNIYETRNAFSKYLVDGLHPGIAGAKKIGEYNAKKFKAMYQGGADGAQGEKGEKGDKGDKGDAGTTDYKALENLPRTPLTVTSETNLQELAEGAYDIYTADDETITLDTCNIELKTGDFIIYHGGYMSISGNYVILDTAIDYSTWSNYGTLGEADIKSAIQSSVSGELADTLTKSGTKYRMETEYTYRLGEQTSIALKGTNSDYGNYDFHSELIFKSGDTATTFTYKSGWIFSGDDCTDGVFIPQANTTYVVKFKNISATDGEEEIVGRVEAYGTASTSTT